jgi:hypothetical protein
MVSPWVAQASTMRRGGGVREGVAVSLAADRNRMPCGSAVAGASVRMPSPLAPKRPSATPIAKER